MELLTKPVVNDPDTGSPDDRAHYVDKTKLGNALVNGGKVQALCGVIFQPLRDPKKYPVCEDCIRIRELSRNAGNN